MQTSLACTTVEQDTGKTNINYTNYTNYTNNYKLPNRCENHKMEMGTPSASFGLASLPSGKPHVVALPKAWRGLKIDVFLNSGKPFQQLYKIKLGIIKQDGTTQSVLAHLGSPNEYVWRGVDEPDRQTYHWLQVGRLINELDNQVPYYKISKCVLPNKAATTELVVSYIPATNTAIIVREGEIFDYQIDDPVTEKQRSGRIVATKYVGQRGQKKVSLKELGI